MRINENFIIYFQHDSEHLTYSFVMIIDVENLNALVRQVIQMLLLR